MGDDHQSTTDVGAIPSLEGPGLEVTSLDVPGLEVTGLDVPGLEVTGLDVPGLEVTGLEVCRPDIPPTVVTVAIPMIGTGLRGRSLVHRLVWVTGMFFVDD